MPSRSGQAWSRSPGRLGWRLLAVTAAGFALPFALHDPGYVLGQYERFVRSFGSDDRTHAALVRVPLDWTVLARTWLDWVPPREVTAAVSLAAATVAAGLVWATRARPLVLALGSVWMTAFGPATEMNTYAVLAGVAAYLVLWRSGALTLR